MFFKSTPQEKIKGEVNSNNGIQQLDVNYKLQLSSLLSCYCAYYQLNLSQLPFSFQHKLVDTCHFLIKYSFPLDKVEYLFTKDTFVAYTKTPRSIINHPQLGLINNLNELKLHITLSWDDYYTHRETLTVLLINHIINGTIPEFKSVHPGSYGLGKNLTASLNNLQMSLEQFGEHARYIEGVQFTIYLPCENDSSYSEEKIAALCTLVDTYCRENKLTGGKYSAIESALTSHIILRKDRINGKYIHTQDAQNEELIKSIKTAQENSNLYRFLSQEISSSRTLHNLSLTSTSP